MPVPLYTSGRAGDRVAALAALAAPAQQPEEPVARGARRAILPRGLLDAEGHSGIHMNDAGELAQSDVVLHRQRQLVDELTRGWADDRGAIQLAATIAYQLDKALGLVFRHGAVHATHGLGVYTHAGPMSRTCLGLAEANPRHLRL